MSEPAGRATIGRDPIAGDNPVGAPLVDAADFDALQAELRRDPVLSPPEWPRVVDLGTRLLKNVSKDFRVASYLCYGLAHADGLRGLRDGLHILLGMTEVHWEKAYPPFPERARARVNAFDWLSEKGEPLIGAWEVDARDRELVSECAQLANDLAKLAEEKLDGADSGLTRMLSSLRELSSRLPAEAAPAAVASAPGVQPLAAGAVAVASGPARPSDVEIKSDDDVMQLLGRCADFLRKRDARAPLAYLLTRAPNCEIEGGPNDDAGKIPFPGPSTQLVGVMKQLAIARDWPALLDSAEDAAWNLPFWLDAHRYAAQALAGLGDEHKLALLAVQDQVRSLVARAPRLLRLRFNDGTALCDPETQRWIDEEVGSVGASSGPARSSAPPVEDTEAVQAGRSEARELAAKGDVVAAIARLGQALVGDGSPRARFLGRFELASFCAELGRDRLARPIFDELVEDAAAHALERWEPELYARVLEASFRCLDRLAAEDPDVRVRAEEVFRRLCRVSPATAAGLE